MKLPANATTILVGAGVALFAYVFFKRQATEALKAVGAAVNPLSDKNIAYKAANAITQTVTGRKDVSFGTWLYDITHPEYDPNAPTNNSKLADSSKVNPQYKPVGGLW